VLTFHGCGHVIKEGGGSLTLNDIMHGGGHVD